MYNTIFSFYPFESEGFDWDHKNYFHSLVNDINDPSDPTDLARGMYFRMMFPNDFDINDVGKKYPLILFLHGLGEKGTTNYRQLVHGGEIHRDAVLSEEFPGFLLYPQYDGNWWADGNYGPVDGAFEIVRKLINHYNVDPNRIYVHGLSDGGLGVWRSLSYYPEYVAAALPMSWAGTTIVQDETQRVKFAHIPIWESQGGRDSNPMPIWGNSTVETIRNAGSNIRYAFMPTTGHGTWNTMYNKPDFFSWMLQYSKTTIHVFYEQSLFCSGEEIPANLKLGVTAGFDGYEWALNSTSNVIATDVNEIIATTYGDYYVRIRRGSEWSDWSDPRTIDDSREPSSPSPVISSGLASITLPALDGSTSVKLFQTSGPTTNYQWYRDDIVVTGATNNTYDVIQQGNFSLTTKTPAESGVEYYDYWDSSDGSPGSDGILDEYPAEFRAEPLGCASNPSNIIRVTTGNGPNSPLPPINFFVFSRGTSENELVYDDNSDNETGFEIYRSEDNGLNYELISIQPASDGSGSVSFSDMGLQSSTQYCYRIRAVNDDGGSPYTDMTCASTTTDITPPTPPLLVINSQSPTSITLSWTSDDDVGVVEYDVYRDGILIITQSQNSYVDLDVIPQNYYTYYIIAKDAAGNQSIGNQEIAASVNSGLNYKYYQFGSYLSTVDQVENQTLIKEGIVDNFDITIADRGYRFGFVFEGYIQILTEGTYNFYTDSDDGSRVIINGSIAFDNDGAHSCGENGNAPTPMFLTEGFHQIKVLFFENGGGECLTVNWSGPGISKSPIPNSVLDGSNINLPNGPNAPSDFLANAISYNQINLSWTDNSNNETGFEVYRYGNGIEPWFKLISVLGPDVETFSDYNLEPSTTYYYRILAKNNTNVSSFVYTNTQTLSAPPAPSIPTNLSATAISTSQISLSWTDNSADEIAFEIYRATYDVESSYILIASTAPDETNFVDSGLQGGTTFYYKILAKGVVNNSALTQPINTTTFNNPPTFSTTIPDRSVQINTILEFVVEVTDPDQHLVTIDMDGTWPVFGSVTNIGQNKAIVKFENPSTYDSYSLRLSATDGIDIVYSNSFTITINDNAVPVIESIDNQQIDEEETLTVYISAADDGGNNNLVLSALNLPSFATFNYGGSGGTASIDFNPIIGHTGYYQNIQIVASDGQGGIAEESFDLIVNALNTSYQVLISFDNSPRFDLPWNYIGGTDLRIQANDIWPIGNIYTTDQSLTSITIDAVEMEQVPDGKSFNNTFSFAYGGPGIQGYNIMPDDVIKFGLAGEYQENNKLIINGLKDMLSYELNFMSSVRTDYAGLWETTIRINGISKTINPVGNATEFLKFEDIIPINGVIEIEMLSTARTMVNAFTLEASYNDLTPPLAPSNLVLEALSPDSILIKWKDNSINETAFDIYRRSEAEAIFSLVGSVSEDIDSLIDNSGINGSTRYYYYVQARNNNGFANSETLNVISLNASPVITQLNPFSVTTGQKTSISVSASDSENDPITLFFDDLPLFASFVDQGNGTGTIILDPDESVVDQSFEIVLQARDSKGATSSSLIIFKVINSNYLQTVYLNLSQSGVLGPFGWNNLTEDPAITTSYGGIVDINNNATSIGLTLSGTWSGQETQGFTYPLTYLDEALLPSNVMKGFWYTEGVGNITFTGLDTELKYNILMFSSSDASDSLENIDALTQYSTGTLSFNVDAFKNPNRLRKFSGLNPNAQGNITISIESLGDVRAVLNAMIIESYVEEQTPFAPTNLVAEVKPASYTEVDINPAPFHVELNWTDNSGIETGFEIYRYDYETNVLSLIFTTNTNVQTYTDHDLPRDKKFGYRLRAIGLSGASEFTSTTDVIIPVSRILLNTNYNYDNVIAAGWNNTDAADPLPGFFVENLNDDFNNVTGIGFRIIRREIGAAGAAWTGVDEAGLYPALATRSFYNIGSGSVDEFQWFGLDDALTYDFIFFGSRIDGPGSVIKNGHSTYKVDEHVVTLNSWCNKDKSVIIRNLKPDNGDIFFSVEPTFSDPNRFNVAFMNVIELRPISNMDSYPNQDFHYYAADNSDINTLTNWYSNPDESGGNPYSFDGQGFAYVISDEKVTNLANNLTIGGLGSKMILKDNIVLNFTANNLTLNLPYLEIDEGAGVTFGGTGLSTATINIGDGGLNIRNGAILNIGNAILNITGQGAVNAANTNGVIAADGGTISITNTSFETNNLYFADGSSLTTLKIDNSNLATLTINDTIRITDRLEVINGHLVTNGFIKLISDENYTAMIPPVGTTSTITGAVEYQRYWARSQGGYYYIGVPVYGQTLGDWQNDFYIQGVQGSYPTYWTNVYTFDEPSLTWNALNDVTNQINPGNGIAALMFNSEFTDGFIRYTNVGNPVFGTFRVDMTYTDQVGLQIEDEGWLLIANPYACAIDLDLIDWVNDANGLDGSVNIWNGETSMYEPWSPSLGTSRDVASGQGFFVKADGISPTPYIDFREGHKVIANPDFLRKEEPSNLLTFKMINQDSIADKFYIAVNDATTFGFESLQDAFKYKNSSHNLYGIDSAGNNLAINSIPALRAQDTLRLDVESAASKSYILEVTGLESLEEPVNIYLKDYYLNNTRLLNDSDRIPFAIDKNTNESFGRRFSLIIGQPGLIKFDDVTIKAGKPFKIPLSLGQLENVAEMNIEVKFNASEFRLKGVNLLNTIPGLSVDTTSSNEGLITLSKSSNTGVLTFMDVIDFVEFEFKPLVHKTGKYSIWINPESTLKTNESANYAVMVTNATIDLRSLRKLKGNIFNVRGRPFNNAIVRLKSHADISSTSPIDGSYAFDMMDNLNYSIGLKAKDSDFSTPDLLDLIQITRYVKEFERMPSNQVVYSSDLNNDGQVNETDLNQMQSLILSKNDNHPGRTVFSLRAKSDAARQVIASSESSESISFVADRDYQLDFLALRKGEIYQNGNSNLRKVGNKVNILFDLVPDKLKSDILHLNLYLERDIKLSGFELHMSVKNPDFEIVGVESNTSESIFFDEFNDNSKNQLGLLWVSLEQLSHTITTGKPFAKLSLRRNVGLGSPLIDEFIEVNDYSKIVDSDFNVNYISGFIPRNYEGNENNILTIYPNPSNGQINVVINADKEEDFKFMFINANGQILFEEARHIYRGTNTINFELATKQLYLAPGYYLIRTENSQWTDVKPFIVKH